MGGRGTANTLRKTKVHYSPCKQEDELRVDKGERKGEAGERRVTEGATDRERYARKPLHVTFNEKKQEKNLSSNI